MPLVALCLVFLSASFLFFSFLSLYISVKYRSVDYHYRPPVDWTTVFLVACHCIIYICNLILKCGKINWLIVRVVVNCSGCQPTGWKLTAGPGRILCRPFCCLLLFYNGKKCSLSIMFRRTSRRAVSGCEDIHHSCTVRFLDETEPLTVTFQVINKNGHCYVRLGSLNVV